MEMLEIKNPPPYVGGYSFSELAPAAVLLHFNASEKSASYSGSAVGAAYL